jgi:predicted membrane chloride channel (bestrophin family)
MVLVSDLAPVPLVLVTGLCTWALFGILEIGLLIEDPFQRVLKTSWTGVIAESVM